MKKQELGVISLFTGAGGLDVGLEAAGLSIRICVENDPDARRTLEINRPNWKLTSPGDIHALCARDIVKQSGMKRGDVFLVAGGPPCQPFSKAAYWANGDTARIRDSRAKTLTALSRVVAAALPQLVLIENVSGLTYKGKNVGFRLIQKGFEAINRENGTNYLPCVLNLQMAEYGIPQIRERVVIVAQRDGLDFLQPPAEFAPADNRLDGQHPYRTAWDAIGDLDLASGAEEIRATGKWAALLPAIPEGLNYMWHTARGGGAPIFGWRTRYWSFLLKLAKDRPSWTLSAEPGPSTGPFHWKNRPLTVREMARIQTFPDSHEFFGNRRSVQRQIGNAVPPAIGEMLGLAIRRQFLGHRVRRKLKLVPLASGRCRPPERVLPVTRDYLALVGNHADHPGVGRGPGAMRRSDPTD